MPINVGKAKLSAPIFDDVIVHDEDVTAEITGLMQRLKIDANNLAEEAEDHPALFARLALLAEEASSEARWAKRRLELAKAECDGNIRRNAAFSGEKKPTEAQVENAIIIDPEVSQLMEEWLDAERASGILGALRQSLTHRREMLVELMRDHRHENAGYGQGQD